MNFRQPGAGKSKVLHLTDIHMDLQYTLGNAAFDCGSEMCCHSDTGVANSTDQGTESYE